MADQETLLPIQDEIIGYATEAYGLAVDLQDLEEAMGECMANGKSEIERLMKTEEERISRIADKDVAHDSTDLLGLRNAFADYLIRDAESAKLVAGLVLMNVVFTLSQLFPDIVSGEKPERWSREKLVYAKRRIAELASATAVLYAPCARDERLKGLFELHCSLSTMESLLIASSYGDQFAEYQMAIADEQRRLVNSQFRIAKEAESQSAQMTRMTKFIMLATFVTLVIAVADFIIAHPFSPEAVFNVVNDLVRG